MAAAVCTAGRGLGCSITSDFSHGNVRPAIRPTEWGIVVDDQADRGEIAQDEFGRPLVRHRLPTETLPTFITRGADGLTAGCSCSEELLLASQAPRDLWSSQ